MTRLRGETCEFCDEGSHGRADAGAASDRPNGGVGMQFILAGPVEQVRQMRLRFA
jgi:hypothetical protein